MPKTAYFATIIFLITILSGTAPAQSERVEIDSQILTADLSEACPQPEIGKIIFYNVPEYPELAKIGRLAGTVNVTIKVGLSGNSEEIINVTGSPAFLEAGTKAARKVKFSPTICAGKTVPVTAIMTYNFITGLENRGYFQPADISGFTDIRRDSPYFGPISDLTETYKICFGYADGKFYEDSPLTRGEFAEFLRLTLDLIYKRAEAARIDPAALVRTFNRQNIKSVSSFKDLKKDAPFFRSVDVLLQTYGIAIGKDESKFHGDLPIPRNEVINIWRAIFTDEAVPIHFAEADDQDRIFSRGEFALYLQESMRILSYKTLP